MTIGNERITEDEENVNFGFWDILKNQYVNLTGQVLLQEPKYWTYYGLGSYGIVGKEIQKAINKLQCQDSSS